MSKSVVDVTIWLIRVACWRRAHAHAHGTGHTVPPPPPTQILSRNCFSTATVVTWTRFSVTLYVHCLSCLKTWSSDVIDIRKSCSNCVSGCTLLVGQPRMYRGAILFITCALDFAVQFVPVASSSRSQISAWLRDWLYIYRRSCWGGGGRGVVRPDWSVLPKGQQNEYFKFKKKIDVLRCRSVEWLS
jgi:hypothetical protein